jgi:hypothetical protein
MAQFVVYDGTGRILRYGSCPTDLIEVQAGAGETAIEFDGQVSDATNYFNGTEIVARPANPATLSGMDIIDVPDGSVLEIEGTRYPVTGTTVHLSFTFPGTYDVRLFSFPWLDTSFEVTYAA